MLGGGTSLRNLAIATLLAALLHIALLAMSFSPTKQTSFSHRTLLVSLAQNREPPQKTPPEELISPQLPSTLPNALPEDILVTAPTPTNSVQEPKIKLQTSLDHRSIQKFVDQETELYRQENPESVNIFSQTFEPSGSATNNVLGTDSVHERAEIRGIGVFATQDKTGNRTCYAETLDLLDPAASSSSVGKDCTPKKKFDLQINKPNNGWTER